MSGTQDFLHVIEHVQFFVVDSQIDVRNSIKEMLQSENFITHTAAGIVDTLVKISKIDFTQKFLFLIEYKLKDGYAPQLVLELCRRNIDATYIMLTDGTNLTLYDYLFDWKRTRRDCRLFSNILFKPVNTNKLMQIVNKHLTGELVAAI